MGTSIAPQGKESGFGCVASALIVARLDQLVYRLQWLGQKYVSPVAKCYFHWATNSSSCRRILALGTPTGQPWMPTTGRAGRVTGCSVKISAPSRLSSGCRRSQFGGGSVIVVTRTATLHRHRPADQGMDDPESRLCCDEIYSVVSIDWRALTLSAHGHSMPGTSTV
ncbi:hypothetical protein BV25DRAFT_1372842 [Artomyces pyxidatus]|uniref:Uncharacterized protein n=1 Tax=Artomyces pyxidatus TaxID=48021 RepID=A0ACB8TDF3_9AGAM|nr:hypothetical protein BV25DRAFT_1372842 [Artomyces pyxidatus]